MKDINVGFIGCGRISDLHAPGYRNNPAAAIYAVCDSDSEAAARRKREWKAVKAYTDYRELLQDPQLDAVEILTPHSLHESMVITAARAGKHIALQKPMGIDLGAADRMLAATRKAGVVFKVTDNYVFYPPIVLAKQMIANGEIGSPTNLRMKFISGESGGWRVPASAWQWRLQERVAGRPLQTFDHGHHLWATAWFLLGDIERVVSWIDSLDGVVDCPSVVMWKYKEATAYGMCEYCHTSQMAIPSNYYANDEWIEITGSRGIIVIHRCTGNLCDGPAVSLFQGQSWRHYADVDSDWAAGFKGATANFISAILGTSAPLLSGEQGRAILRLSLSIQKSSRLRREVYVEELDSPFPTLYSRRKKRYEKKQASAGKGLLARLGLRGNEARYASQAVALTENLIDRFDPAAVEGWQADIGLVLSAQGEVAETSYRLTIKDGRAQLNKGALPAHATLTITSPAGTWAAILLKKKRIETAFLQGRLKLEGNAEEGLKLRKAFNL